VSEEDSQFLGAVTNQNVSNPWETMLLLNNTSVKFQIDTGAEVTVISLDTYKAIGSPPLVPSSKTLRGPSGKILPVMGKFESNLRSDSHVVQQDVYVAKRLHRSLLGRPAIESLGLVKRVGNVEDHLDPVKQFPTLFQGLGKLEGEYTIKLKDGAEPYMLNAPRRIAIPLRPAIEEELKRLEDKGVIAKIGHRGITKCRQLARQAVWWPGLARDHERMITNC